MTNNVFEQAQAEIRRDSKRIDEEFDRIWNETENMEKNMKEQEESTRPMTFQEIAELHNRIATAEMHQRQVEDFQRQVEDFQRQILDSNF